MIDQTLEDLISSMPADRLAELRKLLGDEKPVRTHKWHPHNSPVRSYVSVIVNVKCMHCGSTRQSTHECGKKEVIHTIDADNTIRHTIVTEPCTLETTTRCCSNCPTFIQKWGRDMLEQKYIQLLKGGV